MNTSYIISVKEKTSGKDVVSPFVVSSLDNIDSFVAESTSKGLVVIIDKIDSIQLVPKNLMSILNHGKEN